MLIRRFFSLFVLGVCLSIASSLYANNLQITNVTLSNQDTTNHTYDINFHIYWENSWRDSGADGTTATEDKNWDAAWVFVKYSVYDESTSTWGPWHHASLDGTYYTVPSTCGGGSDACAEVKFGDTGGVYKGAFIYRSSYNEGSGTNDWDVSIRWKYGDDSVADDAKVRIKVFGIEMVFIPPGPFYVGDADADQTNCFYEGGTTHEFYIDTTADSDAESPGIDICVGNSSGCLYYDVDNSANDAGDQTGPIPGTFPNGYDAFYIMKYEITQGQYCEFLNTLTSDQAGNRVGGYNSYYRLYIKLASNGKYGCDANNNAGDWGAADYTLMNESDDGQWVCSALSYADIEAYADWAALRPFTELEFEKACRGPNPVVDDEFPWGDSTINQTAYSLGDTSQASEYIATNYSTTAGNAWYNDTRSGYGPVRAGIFATGSSTRQSAGASFYGVMDLAGNMEERTITVGSSNGRAFDGQHGDGELTDTGTHDVPNWPGVGGFGLRGGCWFWPLSMLRISNRSKAASPENSRGSLYGGRCARTAP